MTKIRAPEIWSRGFTGQGVVVGMADSGVTWDHPALKPHYRGWNGTVASHDYNWHDAVHDARSANTCGSDAPAPCDDGNHGTATASLAIGDDGAGNQIGVAPGARFIACRNMDFGDGTPARYTECFEWFLAPTDHNGQNPRPDLGANVISNSWGCPESEGCTEPDILQAVIENVRAAGLFVAVAASNGGPACATLDVPSYYEAAFAVGATNMNDRIAELLEPGPGHDRRLEPSQAGPLRAGRGAAQGRAAGRLSGRLFGDVGLDAHGGRRRGGALVGSADVEGPADRDRKPAPPHGRAADLLAGLRRSLRRGRAQPGLRLGADRRRGCRGCRSPDRRAGSSRRPRPPSPRTRPARPAALTISVKIRLPWSF